MTTYQYPDYLMHYGVLGMKWGRRKAVYSSSRVQKAHSQMQTAKANKKAAKKTFNKAYNYADNRRIAAFSPSKKQRQRNDERWAKAVETGQAYRKTQKEYKTAKKNYKEVVKSEKAVQKNNKESSNSSNIKTAIKVGAGVAGASLAVYGGYKASQYLKTPAGKRMMDKGMSKIDDIVDDAQFWADNTAIWGKTLAITAKKKMLK